MALTIQDAIDTVFLDTAHYDVQFTFPSGYESLNTLVVHNAGGLVPFTYVEGHLKTPEYTIEVYVTAKQDKLLQDLYTNTMHPGYIDQRYPISIAWGHTDKQYTHQYKCYLASYVPPEAVDYSSANILSAVLTLRVI